MRKGIKFKEVGNGIVCGYCGWKIDKPSDSLDCRMRA